MAMNHSTLRPGLLVSLKTSLHGNVIYSKQTIEREHLVEGGAEKAVWQTERIVSDPVELEKAKQARSRAQTAIRMICARSAFGLLCPENKADQLEAAIKRAREIADKFNESAALSRISVYVMTGRIAPDDVEALKAINSEVRDLMSEMERAIAAMDVKAIRDAANRARNIGTMLTPEAEARVRIAIDTARAAASTIAKASEAAAVEVDRAAIAKITDMRTSFLDLDDDQKEMALPAGSGRALDLAPGMAEVVSYSGPNAGAVKRLFDIDDVTDETGAKH